MEWTVFYLECDGGGGFFMFVSVVGGVSRVPMGDSLPFLRWLWIGARVGGLGSVWWVHCLIVADSWGSAVGGSSSSGFGSRMVKAVPCPTLVFTVIEPPWAMTVRLQ